MDADNGFVPNWWQVIIWTNDDLFSWHIFASHASLGLHMCYYELVLHHNPRLMKLKGCFLRHIPWVSLWIKLISNELDITIQGIGSQVCSHCDVISNQLWYHPQNVIRVSETKGSMSEDHNLLSSFIDSLCHVWNKIMYVLSWRTVYAVTWVLFFVFISFIAEQLGEKTSK